MLFGSGTALHEGARRVVLEAGGEQAKRAALIFPLLFVVYLLQ